MIRCSAASAVVILMIGSAHAAAGDHNNMVPLGAAVLSTVERDLSAFSLVPVDRDDQHLFWATWTDYGPDDSAAPTSYLALIRKDRSSSAVTWSYRYPGAYDPKIDLLYGNIPDHTAVLLRYQLGADEVRATIYALDRRNVVTTIGSVEGEMIDFLPSEDNSLRVTSNPSDPPSCYRRRIADDSLAPSTCRR